MDDGSILGVQLTTPFNVCLRVKIDKAGPNPSSDIPMLPKVKKACSQNRWEQGLPRLVLPEVASKHGTHQTAFMRLTR